MLLPLFIALVCGENFRSVITGNEHIKPPFWWKWEGGKGGEHGEK